MVKGCIDPRAAVELVESLAPPGDSNRLNPAERARLKLAEGLGRPPKIRWRELWHHGGPVRRLIVAVLKPRSLRNPLGTSVVLSTARYIARQGGHLSRSGFPA